MRAWGLVKHKSIFPGRDSSDRDGLDWVGRCIRTPFHYRELALSGVKRTDQQHRVALWIEVCREDLRPS